MTLRPEVEPGVRATIVDRELLLAWQAGDAAAGRRVFDLAYEELRRIAASLLRYEPGCSLSAGDLVGEAVVRLVQIDRMDWRDRAHFLSLAARVMRQVLIDQARARHAGKRAHEKVTLITAFEADAPAVDLIELNLALTQLEALDPARAAIVEMRYFGGMSLEDIAVVTGVPLGTLKRRWRATRLWLYDALTDDSA